MKIQKTYSQSCITVRLAYKGSSSSLSPSNMYIFFFSNLRHSPCGRVISPTVALAQAATTTARSHRCKWAQRAPGLAQAESRAVPPGGCLRKVWPSSKGPEACPGQCMHRSWLPLPGAKWTMGGSRVKFWQLRTPKTRGEPRHSYSLLKTRPCWSRWEIMLPCQCRVMLLGQQTISETEQELQKWAPFCPMALSPNHLSITMGEKNGQMM